MPSGVENPTDYFTQWRTGQITESQYNAKRYEIINDNADPNTINQAGFQWSQLDTNIETLVLPLRQRLQSRGEQLWVNLTYVDFGSSNFEHKSNPAEYAELVLATHQHMQEKYGFLPDSWEIVAEPDNSPVNWTAVQAALALKSAGDRLTASGINQRFVTPATTNASNAPAFIDQVAATPGAMQYVTEFAYHRYCCASVSVLQSIAARAIQYGKQSAMLEWIGADYNTLHEDIKVGRNSSWEQFTLAFPNEPDNGAQYYLIDDSDPNNPTITMGSRTKFLRQYFKFIRSGAVRIEATALNSTLDPLAFINSNGKYVIVVKAQANSTFNVQGLPAGMYGLKYTTTSAYNVDLPDASVASGQLLGASIPGAGVITIYAK